MYGCRVIQKLLEVCSYNEKLEILDELKEDVLQLVQDQNGNHVI